MKLKDYSKEELEVMNYDDIAFIILSEQKKKMKTSELFKKICNTLKLSDEVFESQIGDFFEMMSTDKRFMMLDSGSWDLRINHTQSIVINPEDLEDDEEEILEEDMEDDEKEDEDIFYDENPDDDEAEDDLKDLVVIDEDEEANE